MAPGRCCGSRSSGSGSWGRADGFPFPPSPAVLLARLLPLAVRIDPDRAPDLLWLALSRRPSLPTLYRPLGMNHNHLRQYLDLIELAIRVARYDRASAEAVFTPVAARLLGLGDDIWKWPAKECPALLRAVGTFDARVARAVLDTWSEDREGTDRPDFRRHSKSRARITLAKILGLSPGLRLREPFLLDNDGWFQDFED